MNPDSRGPYTPEGLPMRESREELAARIPGWGVDRNPADRPSVPRLQSPDAVVSETGSFPERQVEKWPRERSIEHGTLPPVFGTSCPPHGLSGMIRRLSYRRFSEGRAAHWLLLLLADRVESGGSVLRSFLTTKPDNPITETGVLAEITHHGVRSRLGRKRTDVKHQWLDPIIVVAPWAARIGAVVVGVRAVRRRRPA